MSLTSIVRLNQWFPTRGSCRDGGFDWEPICGRQRVCEVFVGEDGGRSRSTGVYNPCSHWERISREWSSLFLADSDELKQNRNISLWDVSKMKQMILALTSLYISVPFVCLWFQLSVWISSSQPFFFHFLKIFPPFSLSTHRCRPLSQIKETQGSIV